MAQGEIVRFDPIKGYGFIAPRDGGEDIFLHVNDLLDDKNLLKPGVVVEFIVESGERGLKASSVHTVLPPAPAAAPFASAARPAAPVAQTVASQSSSVTPEVGVAPSAGDDYDLVDVLSEVELKREVTELLLGVDPGLSGHQILAIRDAMCALGNRYGWIG